eukprot:6874268-Prymnesium_polylepis.1
MGDGRGRQTLAAMWDSPMRLEHDLQDAITPNPVMAWLSTASRGTVAARFWQLQQQLEELAAAHRPILRRPAFATGLVRSVGRAIITHFDEYNNTALVLMGIKTFLIAPPDAMSWEDGPQNGNRNEILDVNPLLQGRRYPEPPFAQWQRADLSPGDVLYLPSGWWHHVVSTSHSVMTNVWTGLDAVSCALVEATVSASMLESTGTRSIEPCALSMLATHAAVVHRTCRTK